MKAIRMLRRPVVVGCLILFALLAALAAGHLRAQSIAAETEPAAKPVPVEQRPSTPPEMVQNFHLKYILSQNDLTGIQTDLRNAFPRLRIFAVSTRDTITVRGTAGELEQIRQFLNSLDQPPPVYRLTFTLTEIEDSKRQAPERYSIGRSPTSCALAKSHPSGAHRPHPAVVFFPRVHTC